MGRRGHLKGRRALAAACVAAGLVSIASAQVTDGGKSLRLTLGQTLQYSDNIEQVTQPQDNTLRSSTRLGFDYRDITRTQRLIFSSNATYEVDQGGESDVSDPFVAFSYAREGTNTRFSFSADYRRIDLDEVTLSLSDLFTDIDFADQVVDNVAIIETGIRTDTSYEVEIETGLQSLVGFRLNLSSADRRYDELQLFDQADNRLLTGEAEVTFRIDPALTARMVATFRDFRSENEDQTERRRNSLGVGFLYDVTSGTQLDVFVARDEIEREDVDAFRNIDGVRLSTELTHTLPNGEISTNFSTQPTLNGRESTLRVNRSQALRGGAQLSYGLGVSHNSDLGTEPLFNLTYVQPLRRGRLSFDFNQEARSAEATDEQGLFTQASLGYALALSPRVNFSVRAGLDNLDILATTEFRRSLNLRSDLVGQINEISSWSIGATVTDIEGFKQGLDTDEQRYGIEMAYRRELTRDWNMVARYQHSAILNSDELDRRANTISLGIERTFDTRF